MLDSMRFWKDSLGGFGSLDQIQDERELVTMRRAQRCTGEVSDQLCLVSQ
jgi:hypothetical protein